MLRTNLFQLITCFALCSVASAGPITTFDFSTDDSGVAIANGQQIDDEFSSAFTVSFTGLNGVGVAALDTTPGGPNASEPLNTDMLVDLGNALIYQYGTRPAQTVPGIFDSPTDNPLGGTINFDFTDPTQPSSITLIDIDDNAGANVRLYDTAGKMRTYTVPNEWTNDRRNAPVGYADLDLTSLLDQTGETAVVATASEDAGFNPELVSRMEVQFLGSGGVDNLVLRTVPEPTSQLGIVLASAAMVGFIRRRR